MPIFYGWKLSYLSLFINLLLQGACLYCMNAFMEPLCATNGWSRGILNTGLGIAAFIGQIAMPWAAAVSAKYSLRFLMTISTLFAGISCCFMGLTNNILIYTLLTIILWVSSQFCTVGASALMSNWFIKHRGLALGVATSGTSFSGVVLPFIALLLIKHFGIALAYISLGLCICLLSPICWKLVRRSPALLGLFPDGEEQHIEIKKTKNISWDKLFHAWSAWSIGIAFGMALMTGAGFFSQAKPRFSDIGLGDYTAMLLASIAALCGTFAKFFWGYICDITTPIFAARLLMIWACLSMGITFLPPSFITMLALGVLFGLSIGGLWVVLPALTSYYFGADNFLPYYKFITIFILIRSFGFPAMGISYDLCGSYFYADIFFTICLFLSTILVFLLQENKAAENKKSE